MNIKLIILFTILFLSAGCIVALYLWSLEILVAVSRSMVLICLLIMFTHTVKEDEEID
jgi:hypothetical protein